MLSLAVCFSVIVISSVRAQICDETTQIDVPVNITRPANGTRPTTPCVITLTAVNDYRLKVIFSDLKNMNSSNASCTENYVKFSNEVGGLSSERAYCDKNPAPEIISNGSRCYVQYGVQQNETSNFTIQVKNVNPRLPCGTFPKNFAGTSQVFEFPAQNQTVEVGTECTYNTETTSGSHLTVKISSIRLGPNTTCTNDYVVFGSSSTFNLTSDYVKCGTQAPQDSYTTTGNSLHWRIKVTNVTPQPYLRVTIESGAPMVISSLFTVIGFLMCSL
ncbi:hypothetical protein FGIG_01618 [Fasciola gigantica]|uniref:CUB domain-containing protein n=1 Tax=Fasciola gigantica TaxID=46835 RepID=A0A504YGE5_FASGI|nr:hypothetical protein FGIG_01618 [Fasciola gigantica]